MCATTSATPDPASGIAELIRNYRLAPNVFDAMLDADGSVRPAWMDLLARLQGVGESGRRTLDDNAQRILRENGVTFVAQGDADSTSRPWKLDLLPLVIAPGE